MRRFHNYPKAHDDFKLSRGLYFVECLFEYFVNILVSGAYLAKLTTSIGLSDSMTAILSELTALSGIFQIFSIYLSHKTPVKKWLIPMMALPQLLFAAVYLIPLFDLKLSASLVFFIAIFAARAIASVAAPIKSNWFMSLVEPSKRGKFTATNQIISIIGAMAYTFAASALIDYFESVGNMNGAYLTFSITILVLTVLHAASLILAKENAAPKVFGATSPFSSARDLLKNKAYARILVLYSLFTVAATATTPFLGTYQINELGFSMTFISVMDICMSILNVVILYFFGRYSMHTTYSNLVRISHVFYLVAFGFIIFTLPAYGALTFIGYRIFLLIGAAARSVSATNLLFGLAPPEDRISALAINTIVTGVIGFATTLALTPLVNYIQASGNKIFGIEIYAQQFLAIISSIFFVLVIIYYHARCKKLFTENPV